MKIAYNPIDAAALLLAPANNDITFDLSGLSIYVKGVRFKGTDTTYSVFKKHGSSGGGYDGLVPVPNYNNDSRTRFLREDGTWLYVTDLKVLQAESMTDSFRPIVLGLNLDPYPTNLANSVIGLVYITTKMYALPSTGYLYASKLFSEGKEVLTEHLSLANYVTLNTNLTITGVKTFSALLKFTVEEGTSPFTVTSTSRVANLNSDLLDGYHATDFYIKKADNNVETNSSINSFNATSDSEWAWNNATKATFKIVASNNALSFLVAGAANEKAAIIQAGHASPSYAHYLGELYLNKFGGKVYIGTVEAATINSNVASATKLQTARTIWGQSFDGTADVSGALTSVTDITASGTIKIISQDTRYITITGGDINFHACNGGWAAGYNFYDTNNSLISTSAGSYGDTDTLIYHYYGGTYSSPKMVILPSGNVGIGTVSPTQKLYVNGNIIATGTITATTFNGNATSATTASEVTITDSSTAYKILGANGTGSLPIYRLTATVGSSAKPIYLSGGVPTACGYSFKGLSTLPVVLVSGYFYRNLRTSTSWYFSGYKHSEIGSPSFSVNGGVMTLTFSNSANVYFVSAYALPRQNFWGTSNTNTGEVQSYSGGEYTGRSAGSYWLNTYVYNSSTTSYLYIRNYRQTDSNNDSWGSYSRAWTNHTYSIQSVSFTIFGYISLIN